jgi:uncharacterized DUF497 family protein
MASVSDFRVGRRQGCGKSTQARNQFLQAIPAFRDPSSFEYLDQSENYGEDRFILVGMSGGQLLTIVYTQRADPDRVGSSRPAGQPKMKKIATVRMGADGTILRVAPDGQEESLSAPAIPSRTEAEIEAAAESDVDNPPIMPERRSRLRPVPRVKTLRRALGLTQKSSQDVTIFPLVRCGIGNRAEPNRTKPRELI